MSDVIASVAAIISLVAVYFTFQKSNSQKRQNALALYEKWDSVEFSKYRAVSWDVWLDLKYGRSRGVIDWLSGKHSELTSAESEQHFSKENRVAVRALMNYFVNIYEYHKLGLIDTKVSEELFREPWTWWADFFRTLRMEVEAELKSPGQAKSSAYNDRVQKTVLLDEIFSLKPSDLNPPPKQ